MWGSGLGLCLLGYSGHASAQSEAPAQAPAPPQAPPAAEAPVPPAAPEPPAKQAGNEPVPPATAAAPSDVSTAEAPTAEPTAPAAEPPRELGAVVVTGVRGGRPRSVIDSPSPVDVIGQKEIEATGHTGLKEVLGAIVPALSLPAQAGGGTSSSVRPYTYRGLSGDYLLVLVNGKRRHTTALINNLSRLSGGSTPVDLDLIPAAAIGRIEILRDGAAAQYGSDAISGVLNIILDEDPETIRFSETAGSTYERGAELYQQTLSLGIPLGGDAVLRVSAEAKLHNPAWPPPTSPIAALRPNGQPNYYYPPLAVDQPDPREGVEGRQVLAGGYGRSNRDVLVNAAYNLKVPLGADLSIYSFSTLSYRNIKDARGSFPANNIASLPELYPNGFQAYRRIWEWDGQVTAGARGLLATWDWDLSSSYGRDHVKLGAENTLNPSLGPTSPTTFFMGRQKQDLWVNNLDISHGFSVGLAEPLVASFGVEHRYERFENEAGEPDSYRDGEYVIPVGSTPFNQAPLPGGVGGFGGLSPSPGLASFTGTSPADARALDRNNVAAYVDLFTNVTPEWYLGGAARAEHYDDSAGDTLSGKLVTRYELLPGLAVRAGINTGFRAPSLGQTGFSTTQNTVTVIGDERVRTTSKFLPVDSPAAQALGARPLEPETSLSYTGGVTFEHAGVFRLTADTYQTQVDDRIVKTDFIGTANNGGAAVGTLLEANGIPDVDSAQFFTNALDSRTRGIDIVAEYTLAGELGRLRPNVAFSYARTKITALIDNPPELDGLDVVLFGRQGQIDLVRGAPKDKLIVGLDWSLWRFEGLIRVTRYGRYTEASTTSGFDSKFGAKGITDVELGYQLSDNVTIAAGANNLFDVYPDAIGAITFDTGLGQYGTFGPFGYIGGFYYARVNAEF
jgi:iron complex outermembrane receptor protein